MTREDKQKVLDVLNSLKIIETGGGEESYALVTDNMVNRRMLHSVGVKDEVIDKYSDMGTFCVITLAFSERYADDYKDGRLVMWKELVDDELRYRVLNGEGTAIDAERLLEALEPALFNRQEH